MDEDDRRGQPGRDREKRRPPWSQRWDRKLDDLDLRIRGLGAQVHAARRAVVVYAIIAAIAGMVSGFTAASILMSQSPTIEPMRRTDINAPLWGLAFILLIAIVTAFIAWIAQSDRTILADAARAAVVFIPVVVLAEIFAYVFNIGWATSFLIPWRLVPWQGSLPTVVLEGVLTLAVLTMVARAGLRWPEPEVNWKKIRAIVPMERLDDAGRALVVIAGLSYLAGCLRLSVPHTWSFIDKECVIVAVYGDTVIAADVDNGRRVAPEFTIYHADSVPPFWQSDRALGSVVRPDSETQTTRRIECPAPSEPQSSGGPSELPKRARP
jgi:hypothetical protein